ILLSPSGRAQDPTPGLRLCKHVQRLNMFSNMRKQLLSYSMHIDFVIPVNGNLTAGLESYKHKAEKAAMDYGFHMAITKWNDEVSREMEVMVKEHGGWKARQLHGQFD
uniref:Uncharacterized protein n=1 Tax=Aegilops tauschii subsp. strangulata TaxID=200361 RepID=A0A453T3N2_AEGTS